MIEELKREGIDIKKVRIDAAGYNLELINNLQKEDITYYIRAVSSEDKNRLCAQIKNWPALRFYWLDSKCRVKKFIYSFLAIPAQISKRARQIVLTLYTKNQKYQIPVPT